MQAVEDLYVARVVKGNRCVQDCIDSCSLCRCVVMLLCRCVVVGVDSYISPLLVFFVGDNTTSITFEGVVRQVIATHIHEFYLLSFVPSKLVLVWFILVKIKVL